MGTQVAARTEAQVVQFNPNARITNAVTVEKLLQRYKGEFETVLSKHIPVDLVLKAALHCVRQDPKLANCSQGSFIAALMFCCETGLIPGAAYEQVHLVAFKGEIKPIVDYRGFIKLVKQTGEVATIEARCVYEKDHWEYEEGLMPKLVHVPTDEDEPGPFRLVYAIARWINPAIPPQFERMTKRQVDKVRENAPGANHNAWVNHYDEQARKTVVKKLCKYLPREYRLTRALQVDDASAIGEPMPPSPKVENLIPGMEVPPQSKTDALADKLAGGAGVKTEPPKEEAKPEKEKPEPKPKAEEKPKPRRTRKPKEEPPKEKGPRLVDLLKRIEDNKDNLPPEWVAKYPEEVLLEYNDSGLYMVQSELNELLEANNGRTEQQPELGLEQKATDKSTPGAEGKTDSSPAQVPQG